jgi:hypothetical protein
LTAWYIYRGGDDRGPLHGRFDHDARPLAGSADYPVQVAIAVPMHQPGEDGLGVESEQAALAAIERAVLERAGDRAVLVGVITTIGVREFVLYTGDDGEWLEPFHRSLSAEFDDYELQMMARRDPDWAVYRAFVAS